MRINMLALGLCGLLVPLGLSAQDTKQDLRNKPDDRAAAVREINLAGLKAVARKGGDPTKPAEITSDEQLARAFAEPDLRDRIRKEVDFTRQKLLFFAWSGSGGDKLQFKVEGEKKPTVVFQYSQGVSRDLRPHRRLFVLPAAAGWRVEKVSKPVDGKPAGVREIVLEGLKGPPPKGDVTRPTEISSADEVDKVFEQPEVAERVKKAVDFGKERLVYFAWSGSGGDRLSYTVGRRSDGPVLFRFQKGKTLDYRPHRHLYAITKNWHWEAPKPHTEGKGKEK